MKKKSDKRIQKEKKEEEEEIKIGDRNSSAERFKQRGHGAHTNAKRKKEESRGGTWNKCNLQSCNNNTDF
ncbi:conserved hypothetical protein [Ricinus communis]|uniref:Uncharacterized protein n=1 Tax=Ricinus communis TaxID=3988 RepID=B9T8E0_RICCO|nr:conserved hypothetical protein [Ricinus communis]